MSSKSQQKAIVIALYSRSLKQINESLEELAFLAQTLDIEVVATVSQKRSEPHAATYFGAGKVQELLDIKNELCADLVIADEELRTAQVRNLSQKLKCEVIDRSELILNIFAYRAQTKQAKLQVELASHKYELSRLRNMWSHFGRIRGGIGLRGMGETQLEVDKRRTRRRIDTIEHSLQHLHKRLDMEKSKRNAVFKVALVGYTNAGKSTLMNQLAGSAVLAEDKLFATLDTTTRRVSCHKKNFILSDTVGFIKKLPHHLVASFHATLAEIREADFLLHVVDVTHPCYEEHIEVVQQTLKQMKCPPKDVLLVLNKSDQLKSIQRFDERLERKYKEFIFVSALRSFGMKRLLRKIHARMSKDTVKASIALSLSDGRSLAMVREHGQILKSYIKNDKHIVTVQIEPKILGRLKKRALP